MLRKGLVGLAAVAMLSSVAFAKDAKSGVERDGKTTFAQSCAVCHSVRNIPEVLVIGNKKDWAELLEEGQQFPSAHGWVGTRKMPRHGGDPKITLNEFISAVAFMANASGADPKWKEAPELDPEMYAKILEQIQLRYQRNDLYDKIGKKY
ncbi:MAG: hypothetical protein IBX44_05570 [Sulfurospirillum sp.]|nr:hypothetical protein [Sulfurospirillum sp.]